jgi:carboxylesterase type B
MYVFDTLDLGGYIASDAERLLVELFSGYWLQMATTGEPARSDLSLWPQYDTDDIYLRIDSIIEPAQQYRKRQCDFWDELASKRPASLRYTSQQASHSTSAFFWYARFRTWHAIAP